MTSGYRRSLSIDVHSFEGLKIQNGQWVAGVFVMPMAGTGWGDPRTTFRARGQVCGRPLRDCTQA